MDQDKCKHCGKNFRQQIDTYDEKSLFYDTNDRFFKTVQGNTIVGCFHCHPIKIINPRDGLIFVKDHDQSNFESPQKKGSFPASKCHHPETKKGENNAK